YHLCRCQGPEPGAGAVSPCAEERADPHRLGGGDRGRQPAGRQHDHRDRVRLARPRPAGGREHLPAQLPARAGGGAVLRGDLCAAELRRRPSLYRPQPEGEAVSLSADVPESVAAAEARAAESLFRRNLQGFLANRLAVGAALVVALFVLVALAAPLIAPHDPNET